MRSFEDSNHTSAAPRWHPSPDEAGTSGVATENAAGRCLRRLRTAVSRLISRRPTFRSAPGSTRSTDRRAFLSRQPDSIDSQVSTESVPLLRVNQTIHVNVNHVGDEPRPSTSYDIHAGSLPPTPQPSPGRNRLRVPGSHRHLNYSPSSTSSRLTVPSPAPSATSIGRLSFRELAALPEVVNELRKKSASEITLVLDIIDRKSVV